MDANWRLRSGFFVEESIIMHLRQNSRAAYQNPFN
jgi:hypothetical protein